MIRAHRVHAVAAAKSARAAKAYRTCILRRGRPEDVAAAIAFVARHAASFITGQSLHVDGEWRLH